MARVPVPRQRDRDRLHLPIHRWRGPPMSVIEQRIRAYDTFVRLPWKGGLSGSERIWMVIYPPSDERRLRRRVQEFELATADAGHAWRQIDLTRFFAHWMATNPFREQYFKAPQKMEL